MNQINWQNVRSIGGSRVAKPNRKRDEFVSKIVGKDISTVDPRLLKFVAEKKAIIGEDISVATALQNSDVMKEELKKALQ